MMMLSKRKINQRRLPMIKKFHRTMLHKPEHSTKSCSSPRAFSR